MQSPPATSPDSAAHRPRASLSQVTNDFARAYLDCGAISMRRRALLAWKSVWLWYAAATGAAVAILFAIGILEGFGNTSFWSYFFYILLTLANLYGVGIFLLLTAHAFAELPKRLNFLRSSKASAADRRPPLVTSPPPPLF